MKDKLTVLYIISENTTTSIPLELAGYMEKNEKINLHIVTFYGRVPNEPQLSFTENVIDLNIPKLGITKGFSRINELVREIQPDILHVHHNISALISIVIAKLNKVRLIVKTEHNDHRYLKWYQKVLNVPILSLADIVVCNSLSTKRSFYLWEKLLAAQKTISIYNGINIDKILEFSDEETCKKIREKYGIASHERLFFCAARLIKQKNFENLIRGFTGALRENKNIRLLIAGSGNLYQNLLHLKNKLDKFNKIQLLGILPREEIFALMNAADFFVILSLWEGFCNAVVEAMASKCPILCSNIVTLREIVGNEVGCFVNPQSPENIKKAILEFAAMDWANIKLLGKQSFKRASELYSIESTAKQYVDQYLKLYNLGK